MIATQPTIGREVLTIGARIAGIVSCLPRNEVGNDYFVDRFNENDVKDVVKMIGVKKRRWVEGDVTTRDLCSHAANRLLDGLEWDRTSVDALIFVSQTPDYKLPATACVMQSELGLSTSCIAFDINLGCSGYPYALWLGMTMIQSGAARRVLLAVGDTISKVVDPDDRSTALLFGDAGTVTALESSDSKEVVHFILGSDGQGATNLIVSKGAYKTNTLTEDVRVKNKDLACLYMDGGEIFNFTLRTVPKLLARTLEIADHDSGDYDAFLFHQANLFMLNHLIKKTKLSIDSAPINIDTYGNTSCASIPLLITTNLAERLRNESLLVSMFGFGVGYSWGSASMSIGPLKIVDVIEI